MKWFAGADHAGYELKQQLVAVLRALGDEVEDLGTHGSESVDYPDFGAAVGRKVAAEAGTLGLVVCGSGMGICIAANKIAGVRAVAVSCAYAARMARAHNDANVLALGQRIVGVGVAEDALRAFRDGVFEGGRHQRRVDKLSALEGADPAAGADPAGADSV
ncbi:ribose 5-phosphate isomerase B [Haliangium ochraceum]|uniref:Sugar-phosphate isomerase, RpiB/LacA/LacB family n=1 Tax=Haliangium ochraceum (strain DSM 14365 / JCM 11303 / SMP-2) TaxID=502025 RepID=D0LGA0_HALO1|nr:ribose 5-phosphate isomerase B [Haliangium ochraceum]ACY18125.1 sugar-phosphate isomerase, RpiB/LacA/LacB family [Haliangium ochraceum DSM 14365]